MIKRACQLLLLVLLGLGLWQGYKTYRNVHHVLRYEAQVEAVTKAHGVEGYKDLVMAMIYTETKGREVDVMQSSESLHGEKGQMSTQEDSIQQGVANLVDILSYAKSKGVDKWAGVQAYNYGKSYIDYIAAHGGVNTLALSEAYSRDVVAKSLGNTTGEQYWHLTPDAILYNKGKLYVDGGNIFYANEVRWHMHVLKWLSF